MNYKEYKQKLKEEFDEYKVKLKVQLDKYKEKQKNKLEIFKNKINKKNKTKPKRKNKGGTKSVDDILDSISPEDIYKLNKIDISEDPTSFIQKIKEKFNKLKIKSNKSEIENLKKEINSYKAKTTLSEINITEINEILREIDVYLTSYYNDDNKFLISMIPLRYIKKD